MKYRIRNLSYAGIALIGLIPAAQLCAETSIPHNLHFYQLGKSTLDLDIAKTVSKKFGVKQASTGIRSPQVLAAFGDLTDASAVSVRGGLYWETAKHNLSLFLQPRLEALQTRAMSAKEAAHKATQFLQTNKLFPEGETVSVGDQLTWTSQTGALPPGADVNATLPTLASLTTLAPPIDVARTVTFRRKLDGIPVYGPQSVWSVDVGAKGVVGFTVSARTTNVTTHTLKYKTNARLEQDFQAQVQQRFFGKQIRSRTQKLIYFEQGKSYIQPAMLYNVELAGDLVSGSGTRLANHIVVPLALNSPEVIDHNLSNQDVLPNYSANAVPPPPVVVATHPTGGPSGPIYIGEYIVRNDDTGWLRDAQRFWSVMSHTPFVRRDYYWDQDWLWENAAYSDNSPWFLGQDHFVLMEGHGAPWEFTTLMNYGDVVHLNRPEVGFGKNHSPSGGPTEVTAYVQFQSCDVVPEPGHAYEGDFTSGTAWDVWWHLFKGMHACFGYRTLMGIWNDVSIGFGTRLGMGCPAVSAWLDATNAGPYGHANGWNYGNTVFVTGHGGDHIYDVTPLPNAGSLTMIWCHP